MHGRHQVRRSQQQHKDQDEARPSRKRRLSGELLAGLVIHVEACVQMPRLLGTHGKRSCQRERNDGTDDDGKLGTHKHSNDKSRTGKGRAGEHGDARHAVQALGNARNITLIIGDTTRNQHDKQRHKHKERRQLHHLNGRQM